MQQRHKQEGDVERCRTTLLPPFCQLNYFWNSWAHTQHTHTHSYTWRDRDRDGETGTWI